MAVREGHTWTWAAAHSPHFDNRQFMLPEKALEFTYYKMQV
jgi:hypothetical protein